ncbi:Uncharacterised protein [uncultured archaeon]|nr:Uncharacterised protein [uncultured archaeon]
MRKIIFLIGIVLFILGALAFFLSGSTSGPTIEASTPTVPFLYGTNQTLWMAMAVGGVFVIILGALLKPKKK